MSALLAFAAVAHLAIAWYAQQRIPRFTATPRRAIFTRAVLAAAGVVVGSLAARPFAGDPALAVAAFFAAFGAVHIPAAVILFLKQQRGASRS